MAIKKVYIGSIGPFLFDDTDTINDPDGDFAGEYQKAITTDGEVGTVAISIENAAEVLASLSGEATASFDFNSQNLTNVGTIDTTGLILNGTLVTKSADEINAGKLLLE